MSDNPLRKADEGAIKDFQMRPRGKIRYYAKNCARGAVADLYIAPVLPAVAFSSLLRKGIN